MSGAAAGIPVVGGLVKGYSDLQAGSAAASADNFNANMKEVEATDALSQAAEQVRQQQSSAYQTISSARANYGASGVQSNTGSALAVLSKSAENSEMDALNIKHAGDMKAWADRAGATLDRTAAGNAITQSQWSAATDFIAGGTSSLNSSGFGSSGSSDVGSFG